MRPGELDDPLPLPELANWQSGWRLGEMADERRNDVGECAGAKLGLAAVLMEAGQNDEIAVRCARASG